MPTDRSLTTVSELVREATAIVDPQGRDRAVVELARRFSDADEPVRGVLDSLEERLAWGADEDLLRLAARAEFEGNPPERVVTWLSERGVELT
jgi:hypothetical protein